jgi:Fe-S cluster biosynthesis and repair protein YggX
MSQTIFCQKYQQDLPALTQPPLPGARGQQLMARISAQAWADWMTHQTRLINEKHLNLFDPASRQYLSDQMERFFTNQPLDAVTGYVPEKPAE